MNFVVIGAGGIGCYYAARLIEAGEQVTLVARGKHLNTMQQHGLNVQHPELEFNAAVNALSMEAWLESTEPEQVDVLIVCLKAMQTEAFAAQLQAWFQQQDGSTLPLVLSLQNGVENEQKLSSVLPKGLVLGGIARRIGAHIIKPGFVESVGPAQVILGLWPNQENIQSGLLDKIRSLALCFNNADIPTQISDDINKELWRKLIINSGVNPLCALVQMETGEATHREDLQQLIKGAMNEAAVAAKAYGVLLTQSDVEDMLQLISTFDSIKPSMLVDREKGRQLEIEEICGVVIRGCQQLGEDAPYNRCISTLLNLTLEKNIA